MAAMHVTVWLARMRRAAQALAALLVMALAAAPAMCASEHSKSGRELWVEVEINHVVRPDFALLRIDAAQAWFVRPKDVRDWQLRLEHIDSTSGDSYATVRIDHTPGLRVSLDPDERRLHIEASAALLPAQYFESSTLSEPP